MPRQILLQHDHVADGAALVEGAEVLLDPWRGEGVVGGVVGHGVPGHDDVLTRVYASRTYNRN